MTFPFRRILVVISLTATCALIGVISRQEPAISGRGVSTPNVARSVTVVPVVLFATDPGSVGERAVSTFYAGVAEADRLAEEAERRNLESRPANPSPVASWPTSLYPCGNDLPPCYVKQRESGGDYSVQSRISSASGAWQFLDSTWANFEGYPRAYLAPPAVQDEKARQLWAGGAGCSHWSAC